MATRSILRDQLASMRRWVESLRAREGSDGLLPSSWQFGDWLDPDAPAERPWEAKTSSDFLANAYYAWSARLAGDAAALLGDAEWAAECHATADRVARLTWSRWGSHAATTQTGCAVALRFGLVPEPDRAAVGEALARLVREVGGRVATGFLGTPLILPALADVGHIDEAYLMLLRREMPSWLYQVEQGATTVWERWDAILPDGSIHSGAMTTPPDLPEPEGRKPHMLSFNHYAYGAVIDWVYRHVAGIAPDPERPGYRGVIFAPSPAAGIAWARGSVEGPYGTVSIDWRIEESGTLRGRHRAAVWQLRHVRGSPDWRLPGHCRRRVGRWAFGPRSWSTPRDRYGAADREARPNARMSRLSEAAPRSRLPPTPPWPCPGCRAAPPPGAHGSAPDTSWRQRRTPDGSDGRSTTGRASRPGRRSPRRVHRSWTGASQHVRHAAGWTRRWAACRPSA